ncbi:MAG: hypothetical protein WKG00_18075 [Polyangiaceae bacterium]
MTHTLRLLSCVAILTTGGCGIVLGLDDFEDAPGGGTGASTSTQGGAGPGPGGGGAGAGGATGGAGNTGGAFCNPGDEEPCYTGPAGTAGQGLCVEGVKTCTGDGSEFGPCTGEVVPAASDDCATLDDDNCDGQPNDGCPCMPNEVQDCYTGPAGTAGKGICKVGTQQCDALGTMFGPCNGDVTPQAETCNTPDDDDCDEQTNEEGAGCVCPPNSTEACYTGPAGTSGVGICQAGQHQCNDQGTAYGACNGEVLPGTEACLLVPDEDCDGSACSEAIWADGIGDGQIQNANDVAGDDAGNVYITGNFDGTMDFGNGKTITSAGGTDIFVAKYSPAGVCQWAKGFGDASGAQVGRGIAVSGSGLVAIIGSLQGSVDFGGGVLTSAGSTDIFVARFSTDGTYVWAKRFGDSSSQSGTDVAFTSANDVAVIGDYYGTINLGGVNLPAAPAPAQAIFIGQLAAKTGAHVWSRGIAASFSIGRSVTADDAGNVYFGGHYSGTANAGCGSQTTNTGYDGWVARYNDVGTCSWSKLFTGTDNTTLVTDLDVDGTSLWALGNFEGSVNIGGQNLSSSGTEAQIFLTRLSTTTGVAAFAKSLGSLDSDIASGIAAAPNGQVHVGGRFQGTLNLGGADHTSAGIYDIFLARFDSAGVLVWSKSTGDAADQSLTSLGRNGNYDLLASGINQGVVTFGAFQLATGGGSDAFVAVIGH